MSEQAIVYRCHSVGCDRWVCGKGCGLASPPPASRDWYRHTVECPEHVPFDGRVKLGPAKAIPPAAVDLSVQIPVIRTEIRPCGAVRQLALF